ncbi:hypothetical protein [Streptomyces megasporus]|uniref:hypothetical protein n=1 Tax=Streptomyces megasporus TaxID=44060 RepID=UPI000B208B7B|nr:hypothetical protein [Streptomyces megasporus]
MRVYFSAPPEYRTRPNWERRLDTVRQSLPDGAELLTYETALAHADYATEWPRLAEDIDGLIVTGMRPRSSKVRTVQLGPIARRELISVVPSGKPVLLHTMEHGLVPLLDCKPHRMGREPYQRLRLTVPKTWSPNAPTLQAALDALRPVRAVPHLDQPFRPSGVGQRAAG